jgi:ribosomal protein L30/L7E
MGHLKIKWTRSSISCTDDVRATIKSLGLKGSMRKKQ